MMLGEIRNDGEGKSFGPRNFEEAIDYQLAIVRATLLSKQKDYGHGNILSFGEQGVLVRASDKMERLKNLIPRNVESDGHKEICNEPIEDTWKDLAGYGIIAMMLRAGTFKLPLKEDV